MSLIHMEPEEFIIHAFTSHARLETEPVAFDSGRAGIVYFFENKDGNTYYMDRIFMADGVKKDAGLLNELYPKMALRHPVMH